jgi:predicted permease
MNLSTQLRYAVRSLIKSPGFAVVAILSLALGIGANTAVFSMLDQVLLHALPVQNPDELVQFSQRGEIYGSNTGMNAVSYPLYEDFRNHNHDQDQVFSGILCRYQTSISASFAGHSELANGELVSGSYFQVLGVRPALGSLFTTASDATRGGAPFAVLGYDFWKTRFAGDATIVGKEILVNNNKLTVIGVAQPGFDGVDRLFPTQIYIPIMMAQQFGGHSLDDRRFRWVQVFARLKPGVSLAQAQASLQPYLHGVLEMEVKQKEFANASPYAREQFLKSSLALLPGARGDRKADQYLEGPLWAMMGMVLLVLLMACANVANLMVARSMARQKEVAIRLALGATRMRLVGQLLLESGILSLVGAALGFVIARPAMRLLNGFMPQIDPPLKFVTDPDLRALAFTIAVSVFTALAFGLAPALRATRPDLAPTLKDQAGAVVGGGQSMRKMLVMAQVALSLLLLTGAGLFSRSLANLKDLGAGFEVHHLLSFNVDPKLNGYNPPRAKIFYQQLTQQLKALPGAQTAALCVAPLLSYNDWDSNWTVEGYVAKPGENANSHVNYVSPGFFNALQIPMDGGRDFTDKDSEGAPKVAIVNRKFARYYFGDRDPVGRHIGEGNDSNTKTNIEIIGVVGDTKYETMRDEIPRQVYTPYLQTEGTFPMTAYVRSGAGPAEMFPMIRSAVQKLDSNLPIFMMKTAEQARDESVAVDRMAASLSTAFGVLATLLAAIGLYGVMAFLVTRRTREIGVRMALGAGTGNVLWLVVREVLMLAGFGVVVGLPLAIAATRLLASLLYGVGKNDPLAIAVALLGIIAVAVVSAYLPARRATRVDPVTALRYE